MIDLKTIRERTSSYSVLVVDDEKDILDSVVMFCNTLFGEVESAENGQVALEKFNEKGDFDMVLSDISMPKMNGVELANNLLSGNKSPFIVLMSGFHEQYSNDIPKDCVIKNKPLSFEDLTDILLKFIDTKKDK